MDDSQRQLAQERSQTSKFRHGEDISNCQRQRWQRHLTIKISREKFGEMMDLFCVLNVSVIYTNLWFSQYS